MSINKLITINEILTHLVEETSPDVLEQKPALVRWAKECDQRIGAYYTYQENYYLRNVNGYTVQLPDETVHVVGIIYGDYLDQCPDVFNNYYNQINQTPGTYLGEDVVWKWSETDKALTCRKLNWSVQNNQVVFPSNMDAQEVTLKLLTYQTDKDGFILFNEHHVQAISLYLQKMLAKQERWRNFKRGKLTTMHRAMIDDLEREYHKEVRRTKSDTEPWTDAQMQEISNMINHPFSGTGFFNTLGA